MPRKIIKLNLGCGTEKLLGYVNIDVEKKCKPDVLCDFTAQKLPFKGVSEIVLFHTIEHINKKLHSRILRECWRVLKPDGRIIISYPEFLKCVKNWRTNYRGMKEFWEHTIFGRQLYPSDFHVCIMHTPDFLDVLKDCGFKDTVSIVETLEPHNTVVTAVKGDRPLNYEALVKHHMSSVKFEKTRKKH